MTLVTDSPEARFARASSCWIYRSNPSGCSRTTECLERGVLLTGWSEIVEADQTASQYELRSLIKQVYHATDSSWRRSGAQASYFWTFLRRIESGDMVLMPVPGGFHVGLVDGPPRYDPSRVTDDCSWERPVTWLTTGKAIDRSLADARLRSRLKIRGTAAAATDMIDEVRLALNYMTTGENRSYESDLRNILVRSVRASFHDGTPMSDFGFERLVVAVLDELGASDARIVPRRLDDGTDIEATFPIGLVDSIDVYVQCKWYEYQMGKHAVEELLASLAARDDDVRGWVVTSAEVADDVRQFADEEGVLVIDGQQLAELIVDNGLLRGKP